MRSKSRTQRNTVSSFASVRGPEIALVIASQWGHGGSPGNASLSLPHRANAFGLQALDRVQDQPPRAGRVRRQVEAAQHAVDEQAGFVEHLLELREGVRADGRREFPGPLLVDDDLTGLEPPPEQVERGILKDDGAVVPGLPTLRGQPRHEAVAVEQLHQELSPRPERAGNAPQDLTVLCLSVEVSERREHRDRRIEGVAVWEAAHVPLDERRLDAGVARGLARLREQRGGEVEARHAIPALRQLDRVSTGAARDIEDATALPEVEDLVDRFDLGRGLRMDVADQIIGSEEILVPPFRDLGHRRAAAPARGGKTFPLTLDPLGAPPCRPPRGRGARGRGGPRAAPRARGTR